MKMRTCLILTLLFLGLLLHRAGTQLIGDFYWRMAYKTGIRQDEIILYLEKCVAIDSKNPVFHYSLGRAYLQKGLEKSKRPGKASGWIAKSADEFRRAIDLNPSRSDYHFHLAVSYGSLGYPPPFYWKGTQKSIERAIMLNPTDTGRLYSAGVYYLREYDRLRKIGQNVEDLGSFNYRKYATMSRDNYQFYFRKLLNTNEEYLGTVLTTCYSVTQGYPDLRGVIRDASSDHAFLAHFLNTKGMWEAAKVEFQKAIELEYDNPSRYSDFARALFNRGEYENAIYWWRRQKDLNPRDEGPYLSSANTLIRLNRFDDALEELRSLMVLDPENISYRVRLIRTLLTAHRFDEAVEEYCKMMESEPHLPKTTCNTIRHHRRNGDHKKVARIINEALSSVLQR